MTLQDLKTQYDALRKKYSLPIFNELNENFDIEKIDKESEILLKMIRKVMMDKVINSLGFIEMLLNPVNAPRLYFSYLKSIGPEDKKSIDKIYRALAEINLAGLNNEIEYSEKQEAELIKTTLKTWKELQKDFNRIVTNVKSAWTTNETRKERSYFG